MNEFACSSCGYEQSSEVACERCSSPRIVLVSVLVNVFGEDWRSTFAPRHGPTDGDPRIDQGHDEPLVAHGAGPAAPRRMRSYCKCGGHH